MTEKELKEVFSKNLSYYRKNAGMTQIQLAQKLNYSDKSISKWERAEGLPDVFVLLELANIFDINVDNLLNKDRKSKEDKNDIEVADNAPDKKEKGAKYSKTLLYSISIVLVCIIGVALYVVPQLVYTDNKWFTGVTVVLPALFIAAVVYTNIFLNRFWQFLSVSGLIWSLSYCFYYFINIPMINSIFLVAGILQILAIGWYLIKD